MGSNDYINNYFMPKEYLTSRLYTPDEYADVLIRQYSRQLEVAYNSIYNDNQNLPILYSLYLNIFTRSVCF